jgi:hypothetical protein
VREVLQFFVFFMAFMVKRKRPDSQGGASPAGKPLELGWEGGQPALVAA